MGGSGCPQISDAKKNEIISLLITYPKDLAAYFGFSNRCFTCNSMEFFTSEIEMFPYKLQAGLSYQKQIRTKD